MEQVLPLRFVPPTSSSCYLQSCTRVDDCTPFLACCSARKKEKYPYTVLFMLDVGCKTCSCSRTRTVHKVLQMRYRYSSAWKKEKYSYTVLYNRLRRDSASMHEITISSLQQYVESLVSLAVDVALEAYRINKQCCRRWPYQFYGKPHICPSRTLSRTASTQKEVRTAVSLCVASVLRVS